MFPIHARGDLLLFVDDIGRVFDSCASFWGWEG